MALNVTARLCVAEGEPGKWTNVDWGKAKLTPCLVTIQRLNSALSLPLENLCVPEKDSKETKGQI